MPVNFISTNYTNKDHIHTDYSIKCNQIYFKSEGAKVRSEIAKIGIVHKDKLVLIIAVSDILEQCKEKNILHFKSIFVLNLLYAALNKQFSFTYEECLYYILYFNKNRSFNKATSKLFDFCNTKTPKEVVLYQGRNLCSNHPNKVHCITALVWCSRSEKLVPISLYHCEECNFYFINYESYKRYADKFGLPFLQLTTREHYFSTTNDYYSQLREQSDLAIYGYNVNQYTDMTHCERINLLTDLIDMGLITKAKIINHIEYLLRSRRNEKYRLARIKWQEDLEYINDYKINTQRFVWTKLISPNNLVKE